MFKILPIAMAVSLVAMPAHATYSIIACDEQTHACGVAVQTNNLAVGASVPFAAAGVGAIVSQFETNPNYGPQALALLSQGKPPADALTQILSDDHNFDGGTIADRQVAVVSADGRTAVHTGQNAKNSPWAGSRSGKGYSIQGNGLVGAGVIEAMERAYLETKGGLAAKLMAALISGDAAGGQSTGRESAALLVKTPSGWPIDVDLRVDDSRDPVAELNRLFNMNNARQQVIAARRAALHGNPELAKSLLLEAVAQSSNWPRVLLPAAHLAVEIGEPRLAIGYLNTTFSTQPGWIASELGNGTYAVLGHDPAFRTWIGPDLKRSVEAEARTFSKSSTSSKENRILMAEKLLEIDDSARAIMVLTENRSSPQVEYLLALSYAAQGDYSKAKDQCQLALAGADLQLRPQLISLDQNLGALQYRGAK